MAKKRKAKKAATPKKKRCLKWSKGVVKSGPRKGKKACLKRAKR